LVVPGLSLSGAPSTKRSDLLLYSPLQLF